MPTFQPQRSCEIYYKNMAVKNRGSPLWIPEPNNNLSVPYRKKGVSIGDVGILTESGGFCFFFNICLPRDHVINRRGVPPGFVPMRLPAGSEDIQRHREFHPDSYLVSESIGISRHQQGDSECVEKKYYVDTQINSFFTRGTGLTFESTAAQGAVLTMPRGAHSEDLINIRRFRRYVAENIENWYRYVVGVRGCEAKNGDIRLVTGCDKASAWGMAIFANSTIQHEAMQLKFQATGDRTVGKAYQWEYSGTFDTRTGPDLGDIEELKTADPDDSSTPLEDIVYNNQCLFVRTLNTTLRDDVWDNLSAEIDSGLYDGDSGLEDYDSPTGNQPPPTSQGGSGGTQEGGGGTSNNGSTVPRTNAADDKGPPLRFSYSDAAIVSIPFRHSRIL